MFLIMESEYSQPTNNMFNYPEEEVKDGGVIYVFLGQPRQPDKTKLSKLQVKMFDKLFLAPLKCSFGSNF